MVVADWRNQLQPKSNHKPTTVVLGVDDREFLKFYLNQIALLQ